MKIILSPAKKMNADPDSLEPQGLPVFLEQTREILAWLQGKSYGELKALWGCNDKIAGLNFERLKEMELEKGLTPAVLSYEGIAYQYMAPTVFEEAQLNYIQEHLRILSGFYGVLKPMDGVTPYRLEMQARAAVGGHRDLYGFWGSRLYREVRDQDGVIVNLASKEYARCIERYLTPSDTYITCIFGEWIKDGQRTKEKLVQKGTYAKMARGEMVRFMAENRIQDPRELKAFDRLGYVYCEELSDEREYVFERVEGG